MTRFLPYLGLVVLVALGAWLRTSLAFSDPGFDLDNPVGMLKSDPALLYYITERTVEAEGLLPADLRADARVEHPTGADLARDFTIGQELLVAWTYRAFDVEAPLHVHAQRVMAWTASLVVLGVFLLVRAGTGRAGWALFAATLAALMPANYRTIGFVLVREDLSLPLFALHAGLAARAAIATRGSARWAVASGLALAAALATWHAMTFVVAIEGLAVLFAAVWTGRNPLGGPRGWAVLIPVIAAGILVPTLRARGFLLSAPVLIAASLLFLAWLERRGELARSRRAIASFAALVVLGLLSLLASRLGWSGGGELGHVYEVLLAKLRHLGVPPADPNAISFNARLLWQGPFDTLALGVGAELLAGGLVLGGLGALLLLREHEPTPLEVAVLVFVLLSLPMAWLIARTVVLPGLALPALAGLGLAQTARRQVPALVVGALMLQGLFLGEHTNNHEISWYKPTGVAEELRALCTALPELVPEDEAICADFVNSTAVLAHTHRPIVLQPKYETEQSRRKAEAFLTTFFHGTPDELATLLRDRFDTRYLLVDRYVLGYLSTWTAGLPDNAPLTPGTAAAVFLSRDSAELESVPGFELIYRSPATILQSNGEPYDLFRLYRLGPD